MLTADKCFNDISSSILLKQCRFTTVLLLPQAMLSTSEDLMLRKEGEVFYEACDIRVIQNAKVVAVRPMENVVKTEVGDIFQYDFLVLASGGKPKTLDIAKDIPNVYLLRTPEDGNKIGMRKSCTVLIGNFLDVYIGQPPSL